MSSYSELIKNFEKTRAYILPPRSIPLIFIHSASMFRKADVNFLKLL